MWMGRLTEGSGVAVVGIFIGPESDMAILCVAESEIAAEGEVLDAYLNMSDMASETGEDGVVGASEAGSELALAAGGDSVVVRVAAGISLLLFLLLLLRFSFLPFIASASSSIFRACNTNLFDPSNNPIEI